MPQRAELIDRLEQALDVVFDRHVALDRSRPAAAVFDLA